MSAKELIEHLEVCLSDEKAHAVSLTEKKKLLFGGSVVLSAAGVLKVGGDSVDTASSHTSMWLIVFLLLSFLSFVWLLLMKPYTFRAYLLLLREILYAMLRFQISDAPYFRVHGIPEARRVVAKLGEESLEMRANELLVYSHSEVVEFFDKSLEFVQRDKAGRYLDAYQELAFQNAIVSDRINRATIALFISYAFLGMIILLEATR